MKVLRELYKYWMKFAGFIGRVNSVIILTILFVVVVGLYSIILKIVHLLFIWKPAHHKKTTFWIDKKYNMPELDILKRQF